MITEFTEDLCVAAGAGCGKTTALTDLYVDLLSGGERPPIAPSAIVTITFTNKAAAEMKGRVADKVDARLQREPERPDPTVEGVPFWERRRRELVFAPIGTFHSLCGALLREFALDADLEPDFRLLDENRADMLLTEAVEEVITRRLHGGASDPAFHLLLRAWPFDTIAAALKTSLKRLSSLGMGVREAHDRSRIDPLTGASIDPASLYVHGLSELRRLSAEVRGKNPRWDAFVRIMDETETLLDDLRNEAASRCLGAVADSVGGNWGSRDEKPVKKRIKEIAEEMQAAWWQVHWRPVEEVLVQLLDEAAGLYADRKKASGALDFDDLLIKARDLLRNNEAVLRECQKRFEVILVDEFQDTNALQKELVDLLRGNTEGPRLFVVGDDKQSIYRFRGADVAVFTRTRGTLRTVPLSTNYRSTRSILSFVNELFSRIMGEDGPFSTPYRDDAHLLHPNPSSDPGPPVEYLAAGDGTLRGADREAEADAIARRIISLDRPLRDVAILFRSLRDVAVYTDALQRYGLPSYVVRGRGFYQCREVSDVLHLLRYVEHRTDEVALAAVLRSPFVGISDETLFRLVWGNGEKQRLCGVFLRETLDLPGSVDPDEGQRLASFHHVSTWLVRIKDRLSIPELIEQAIERTGYATVLAGLPQGEQRVFNLKKLIELSRDYEREGAPALKNFINYLTDLSDREPTEAESVTLGEADDVVRLMTIHQAKGLEFPVVFVADMQRKGPSRGDLILVDEERGLGIKAKDLATGETVKPLGFRAISDADKEKEEREICRLLYVALTRARERLILVGKRPPMNSAAGFLKLVKEFVLESPELVVIVDSTEIATKPREKAAPLVERLSLTAEDSQRALAEKVMVRAYDHALPPVSTLTLPVTALLDYLHCPRLYYYSRHTGLNGDMLRALVNAPRPRAGGLSAADKGQVAHRVLEQIDFGSSASREEIRRCIAETGYPLTENDAVEIERGVTEFVQEASGLINPSFEVRREWPFLMALRSDGFSLQVRGTMDLIFMDDEGQPVIVDYKYTGFEGRELTTYRDQLWTYALACRRETGVIPKAFLWSLRDHAARDVSPSAELLDAWEITLIKAGKEIANKPGNDAVKWSGKSSEECETSDCGYKNLCLAFPCGNARP
ncbi:MAG: UvrD-helicase domain-containing protein [Nitrospirota bacterium]|nr:UvrD-helicase domain-containing protein [Nitrospirota bacterium]